MIIILFRSSLNILFSVHYKIDNGLLICLLEENICEDGTFYCWDVEGGYCLPNTHLCDSFRGCSNAHDESNCNKSKIDNIHTLFITVGGLVYPPKLATNEGAGCRVKCPSDTQRKLLSNYPCFSFCDVTPSFTIFATCIIN